MSISNTVYKLGAKSLLIGALSVGIVANSFAAQDNYVANSAPEFRGKVSEQLSRAKRLANEGELDKAFAALANVESKIHSMNSHEIAKMHDSYGVIYYGEEKVEMAIQSFEKVVEQDNIPKNFEMRTLFNLAQLHLAHENYAKSIAFLERWEGLNKGEIPAKNYIMKAQAQYQLKEFSAATFNIDKAVVMAEEESKYNSATEGWYILQRAIAYEMQQPEKVKNVIAKLIKFYNQPKYWMQLSRMYGELGEEQKQLAVLETAYTQGHIHSESDIYDLAQLYYYHKVPFKGAKLMEDAMEAGKMERNQRNLTFLSQSWTLAKEIEKAVPAMQAAASFSNDGELDAQLATILLNSDQFESAINAAERALDKGHLKNEGNVHIILGMALYNIGEYSLALRSLGEAENFKEAQRMAQQWRRYVNSEKTSYEQKQGQLAAAI